MNFKRTTIPDVIICEPKIHQDKRGYFFESFNKKEFEDFIGFSVNFCQDNEAKSTFGVLRGLHYQMPPYAQSKLVRVIKGKVLDVAVDIREKSNTFGKYVAVELSEENKKQLFVPHGFAHGYVVLSEEAIFAYKVDNFYHQPSERGIIYNDKTINVDWKIAEDKLMISEKDSKQSTFLNASYF
ncbi:MAG: dTDP-4-dehydrorhamnose 3,5-epimerase [Lutibacter sp.]